MKKLDIQITKAALKSFSVQLEGEKPSVTATIALLTEGGKQITTYCISTSSYNERDQFELPLDVIGPIIQIAKSLEHVVTKHCRDAQKGIGAGDISEQPIDLSEIPF